jgi:hypothetical protein
VTLNPACASARNLADDSVCRNGVKMPEAEVKRRIALIEDAMSKGRLQKDVVDELNWTRQALIKFMRKNNMPKWEKTSDVVLAFMDDIKENGQNNRTQQQISEQTGIPRCTVRAAVKRMKRDDDGFTWENGGVIQKTLAARQIFDVAIDDGTVRASRRSSGRACSLPPSRAPALDPPRRHPRLCSSTRRSVAALGLLDEACTCIRRGKSPPSRCIARGRLCVER